MENYDKEAVEAIAKSIVQGLKNYNPSYDRTFKSVVTKVTDKGYVVRDESGGEHTVKCSIPNYTPIVGKNVWVKIPCNKINQMHICGII